MLGMTTPTTADPEAPRADLDRLLVDVLRVGAVLEISQRWTPGGLRPLVEVVDPVGRRWTIELARPAS